MKVFFILGEKIKFNLINPCINENENMKMNVFRCLKNVWKKSKKPLQVFKNLRHFLDI